MTTKTLALLTAVVLFGFGEPHENPAGVVTPKEAVMLALTAASSESARKDLPGLHAEPTSQFPSEAGFYLMEVRWNGGGAVGGSLGFYAVDNRTADVWSGIVCREVRTSKLETEQRAVRSRMHLSLSAYRKLRRPGPMC